jgi:hypothetical protein
MLWREHEMIHPFIKIRAGLVAHAAGEFPGKTVAQQERLDEAPEPLLGVVRQRPVKRGSGGFRRGSQGNHGEEGLGLLC